MCRHHSQYSIFPKHQTNHWFIDGRDTSVFKDFLADIPHIIWGRWIGDIQNLSLDRLHLSFENCYSNENHVRPPKVIKISGWEDEKEKSAIEKLFQEAEKNGDTITLQFEGSSNNSSSIVKIDGKLNLYQGTTTSSESRDLANGATAAKADLAN
ncbi:hypothetical protein TruAng_005224 [Truncatella angustata]|nr:hypothetical protein TruAng_005224 [Truncatella angustata]